MIKIKKPKITKIKYKLIALGGYSLFLLVFRLFNLPCFYLEFFNMPCPGCGMTRAFDAAMHLDIIGAFSHHLMFWSVPVVFIYLFLDMPVISKKADRIILISIGIGFLINWGFAILRHFSL